MWKSTKKKIIKNVINTSYIRKKINFITMDIFSFIIKIHFNSIICILITTNIDIVDFSLQLLVSLLLYYYGSICNDIVYIYDKKFYKITNYFIDNYSTTNFDMWKKKGILGINIYLITLLYFINITSNVLIIYSIQYMFYFIILDYINNKKWKNLVKIFNNWYYQPKFIKYDKIDIKEDYLDFTNTDIQSDNNSNNIIQDNIIKNDNYFTTDLKVKSNNLLDNKNIENNNDEYEYIE